MEKTIARMLYKMMEIGKLYTTRDLINLIGDDYYSFIPEDEQPGQPNGYSVNKKISEEMWKVVKSGYADTYTEEQTLANLRGIRFGAEPTSYFAYTYRYWIRTK